MYYEYHYCQTAQHFIVLSVCTLVMTHLFKRKVHARL